VKFALNPLYLNTLFTCAGYAVYKNIQSVPSDGHLGAQSSVLMYFNKREIYEVMTCCAFSYNWTHEERTDSCLVKEGTGVTFACKNENEMGE